MDSPESIDVHRPRGFDHDQDQTGMSDIIPLKVPDGWPHKYISNYRKSKRKESLWRWLCAYSESVYATLDHEVESKLRQRELSIEEAWSSYPQYLEIAKRIQPLLKEKLWEFNPVFIPEDSYYLLGQLLTGDLCEVEMIMALEEEFRVEFGDSFFDSDLSMLQLVEFIAKRGILRNR